MPCENCKYWDRENEQRAGWEGESIDFRICKAVRPMWEIQDEANGGKTHYPGDDDAGEEAWGKRRVEALRA